jgi:hypothetical protein
MMLKDLPWDEAGGGYGPHDDRAVVPLSDGTWLDIWRYPSNEGLAYNVYHERTPNGLLTDNSYWTQLDALTLQCLLNNYLGGNDG